MISATAWPLLEGRVADILVLTRLPESRPQHAESGDIEVLTRKGERYSFVIPNFTLATVGDLGKALQDLEGTPVDQQRLLYDGRELEEGRTLDQYGIKAGATVGLVRRSRSNEDWNKMYNPIRHWQASHPPVIRVQPRGTSDQEGPVLVRLVDTDRQVITFWNGNLEVSIHFTGMELFD